MCVFERNRPLGVYVCVWKKQTNKQFHKQFMTPKLSADAVIFSFISIFHCLFSTQENYPRKSVLHMNLSSNCFNRKWWIQAAKTCTQHQTVAVSNPKWAEPYPPSSPPPPAILHLWLSLRVMDSINSPFNKVFRPRALYMLYSKVTDNIAALGKFYRNSKNISR